MKKSSLFTLIIFSIFYFYSCNQKDIQNKNNGSQNKEIASIKDKETIKVDFKSGKHYSLDSLSFIDIDLKEDSLIGYHCFVYYDGKRIDCCETNSIFTQKLTSKSFSGYLNDCYQMQQHKIEIKINDSLIVLYMIKNTHDFIPDSICFYNN